MWDVPWTRSETEERILETYLRTMFLTLKSSSGATSGSSPLSVCRTSCWTIRSNNTQYWRVVLLCLSGDRQGGQQGGEAAAAPTICTLIIWICVCGGREFTGHHEAVLQCRQQVRVRFGVAQMLLDQLKHLACTFCFHMNLRQCKERYYTACLSNEVQIISTNFGF